MNKKRRKSTTALSKQSDDSLWQALDSKIGGKKGMLELALASPNPKAAILAEMCLDKNFSRSGTKDLARKAGMNADEVVDMYRNKKWLEAVLALHDKLPDIIGGAAQDAAPRMAPCEECKGKGKDDKGDDCWACGGWGEVRKAGDKDKLRFVGEATGMTNKTPNIQINNQQINQTANSGSESFESLMRRAAVNAKRLEQPVLELEAIREDDSHE